MKRKVFWLSAVLVICMAIFFAAGCFAEAVDETAAQTELKQACLSATVTAIELEIDRYQKWIDLRKQQGDTQACGELEKSLALLRADLEKYRSMAVDDYILPEKVVCTAWVEDKPGVNSLLYIDRMLKSGPFYHLAGITGGDYSRLQPGTRYNMTFYKIFPRSYWNMESDYVYISSVDKALSAATNKHDGQGGIFGPEQRNNDGISLDGGFLGRPWGSPPGEFADLRYLVNLAPDLAVYSVDLDIPPGTGDVRPCASPRLLFSREDGLVMAHIDFAYRDYDLLKKGLTWLLGEPIPIMYELWAARVDFGERSEWRTGKGTRLVLTAKGSTAVLEISKQDFTQLAGRSFEQMFAEALLKRAEEYDRQNLVGEAASIYQIILNEAGEDNSVTEAADKQLAVYSKRKEAVEYLSEDKDMRFYRLINIYAGSTDQQWIRIDLGDRAQAELQSLRPADIVDTDRLAKITTVLCRVKIDPIAGKYAVAEQLWLDEENQIIGDSSAWAPQGWPVPYIREACEAFITAWFSFETGQPRE
ncbi:MAG TPA: hypothetical protein VHP38_17680 [Ruminiclostridium sp.]|nr:hypothetical protein [Ruminiclostridium sp.]